MGSVCIIGENPGVRILNSGEGGTPLACVLSDGGWLGTVCNSPCFRCCSVLNYATHYTTKQVKSQRSKWKTVVSPLAMFVFMIPGDPGAKEIWSVSLCLLILDSRSGSGMTWEGLGMTANEMCVWERGWIFDWFFGRVGRPQGSPLRGQRETEEGAGLLDR